MAGAMRWNSGTGRARARRLSAACVLALAAAAVGVACEPADCTTSWVGPTTGTWSTAANWNAGVPDGADVACLPAGTNVTVAGSDTEVAGVKARGRLTLAAGAVLEVAHDAIDAGSTTLIDLETDSTLRIGGGTGTLTLYGGTLAGSGTLDAAIEGAGRIEPGDPDIAGSRGFLRVNGAANLTGTDIEGDLAGDGLDAGVDWDIVSFDGVASLDATTTIEVVLAPDATPLPHNAIRVVQHGGWDTGEPTVVLPDTTGRGIGTFARHEWIGLNVYVTQCDPGTFHPGADFAGTDLHGFDLRECDLSGADLSGAVLNGADLDGAVLDGANFHGAAMTGVDLSAASLQNTNLTDAIVNGANISNATFSGANLTGIRSGDLTGTGYTGIPAGWMVSSGHLIGPSADLTGAWLAGTDLSGRTLTGIDLTGALLTNVNVNGTGLGGAVITGLRTSNLVGTPSTFPASSAIRHGRLVGPKVNLSGETITSVDLAGINLSGANLAGATLSNGDLRSLNLSNANLAGASFSNVWVDGLQMTGAQMGAIPVGGTFGTNLRFAAVQSMAPPANWFYPFFPAPPPLGFGFTLTRAA